MSSFDLAQRTRGSTSDILKHSRNMCSNYYSMHQMDEAGFVHKTGKKSKGYNSLEAVGFTELKDLCQFVFS
jgi:hypothetical protein